MKVADFLVLGRKGSGKTVFAKLLLSITPRAFVLDKLGEYHNGYVTSDFDDAIRFLQSHRFKDFHLIFRSLDDTQYFALLDLIYQSQQHEEVGPIGIFFEEASFYSGSHTIPDIVERLATKGRHFKVNLVQIAQRDTQINPVLRTNAYYTVVFQMAKFSADMKESFSRDERDRIARLTPFDPTTEEIPPQYGRHFVTDPPGLDPFRAWASAVTFAGGERLDIRLTL